MGCIFHLIGLNIYCYIDGVLHMYGFEEKSWNGEVRSQIIENIRDYLKYYLFKGNISHIHTGIKSVFNLSNKEFLSLKAVHFLLSKEVEELMKVLPFLMRNLAHSTQKEQVEYKGIIRGKIEWNATIKERYSRGFNDPSLFICTPTSKSYDLEENQLLKFLLNKIIYLFENTLNFIKNSQNENNSDLNWHHLIQKRYFKTKKVLKNIYFDGISDVNNIKPKFIRKALNQRNIYYKTVAKVYKLYENLFVYDDLDVLVNLVDNQLLKPASDDTLYELFVFFSLVDSLPKDKTNLGLLMPNNDYSVLSEVNKVKIKIYYQNVPDIFSDYTKYKTIFNNYDINVNIRRPDIVIEFDDGYQKIYRIVEVKRTNEYNYIRNSVYKVLAYFKDFEGVPFVKDIPGVIVCWDGISITNYNKAFNQQIIVLNKNDFLNYLNDLFLVE